MNQINLNPDAFTILETLNQSHSGQFTLQKTVEPFPTIWVKREHLIAVLTTLRTVEKPYAMLFDLSAIDEQTRVHKAHLPAKNFTVFYHLLSFERNCDIRIKVALEVADLSIPSVHQIWPNANWYEREIWDMFGIHVTDHPHLVRILMPSYWEGHPLRKEHHARATEFDPYYLNAEKTDYEQDKLRFVPEDWGMQRSGKNEDFMFLNFGPNHPAAHGAFRIALQLDGEEIVDCVPEIGYHHRGAEKMAERQTWHSFIPYTDRIDYLGGVMNELPYILAMEKLAQIQVPDRVNTTRIMLSEFFRITSHLLMLGTCIQDVGGMTPIFYMFADRQKAYDVIEAITGFRMHPAWFRIGGLAQDLPQGWDRKVREFLDWMNPRLAGYYKAVFKNSIFKARMKDVAAYNAKQAIAWGVTGPNLRATGVNYDLRKVRPYLGYEHFEFEVPIAYNGDCFDRALLRLEEIQQSLNIIEQCLKNMPEGPYKADHPLTIPPPKERTLQDIETLINHFVSVSWGAVMPQGETSMLVETTKGMTGYYMTSDKSTMSYRTRIRTPSFAHLQQIPAVINGSLMSDLIAYLGSIDFVMADVDR